MGRWFGTDGVRDLAGQGRLGPEAVARLGAALARLAAGPGGGRPEVALAHDPRPSGPGLVAALERALRAQGARVRRGGVLPTPALAWWVARERLALGVSVSASHNPPEYNGLKPFMRGGRKLDEAEEAEVEALAEGFAAAALAAGGAGEPAAGDEAVAERYVAACAAALRNEGGLEGRRLCVDLAAGAATATAGPLLAALGAHAELLHPSGSRPINAQCGSEHPGPWLARVREAGGVGLAFDGDADRVLLADESGGLLDGDDLLGVLALDLQRRGALPGRCVVATVMSNLGLERWLGAQGIELVRTPVGDRHVAAAMRARGAPVGGEASGHLVLAHPAAPTALIGDGLVAGIRVLGALARLGLEPGGVRGLWPRFPQRLVNLRLGRRRALEAWPELARAVAEQERRLGARGRVLVRWSGTEPVLRLMAEAETEALVDEALGALEAEARHGA